MWTGIQYSTLNLSIARLVLPSTPGKITQKLMIKIFQATYVFRAKLLREFDIYNLKI